MKKPRSKNQPDRRKTDPKGELAQRVVDSLEESPEARRELMEVVQTESSMMFAGPLPPPGILSGYEDALPGAADRIISMAEANNSANIEMAKSSVTHDFVYKITGMACGFLALAGLVGGAVYCASIGKTMVTYALLGVGALGTISVFVNAWYKDKSANGG